MQLYRYYFLASHLAWKGFFLPSPPSNCLASFLRYYFPLCMAFYLYFVLAAGQIAVFMPGAGSIVLEIAVFL